MALSGPLQTKITNVLNRAQTWLIAFADTQVIHSSPDPDLYRALVKAIELSAKVELGTASGMPATLDSWG